MSGGGIIKLSEAQIQKMLVTYLAALGIDAVAVPNGAHLAGDKVARAKQMAKLKQTGMLPGMADLILFDRRARRVGLVEVKASDNDLTPSQERFAADYVPTWGWPYAVVRSQQQMSEALTEWGWR